MSSHESTPPIFFSPEMASTVRGILLYHNRNSDHRDITRYTIPTQPDLMTYYDDQGNFQIALESESGDVRSLPDIVDIELLAQRIAYTR